MNITITDSRRLNTRSSSQQRLDPGADLLCLARRQVTNGMAVRMAVMAIILGGSAAPEGKRA